MFFRFFVYDIEQFPVTLLKDGDYEALDHLIVKMQYLYCVSM